MRRTVNCTIDDMVAMVSIRLSLVRPYRSHGLHFRQVMTSTSGVSRGVQELKIRGMVR